MNFNFLGNFEVGIPCRRCRRHTFYSIFLRRISARPYSIWNVLFFKHFCRYLSAMSPNTEKERKILLTILNEKKKNHQIITSAKLWYGIFMSNPHILASNIKHSRQWYRTVIYITDRHIVLGRIQPKPRDPMDAPTLLFVRSHWLTDLTDLLDSLRRLNHPQ